MGGGNSLHSSLGKGGGFAGRARKKRSLERGPLSEKLSLCDLRGMWLQKRVKKIAGKKMLTGQASSEINELL